MSLPTTKHYLAPNVSSVMPGASVRNSARGKGHEKGGSTYDFQFALIHGPDIPGSYAILLFTASDLASITSHINTWVLFLLWLHPFILSGVISPLISSSILGTYRPGESPFQYPIILPFHAVHGILKARILKWFAIPFSSGPHSPDLSTMTLPSWVAPHGVLFSMRTWCRSMRQNHGSIGAH